MQLKGADFNAKRKTNWITGTKSDFLNELIKDCIYYGLSDDESLRYVETRLKEPISKSVLWTRKSKLRSEKSGTLWLTYFTRFGYVLKHKKLLELTERLIDGSTNELFHELEKPYEFIGRHGKDVMQYELKNDLKILRLKNDIRESIKLYREILVESPIISQIKTRFEKDVELKIKLMTEYGMEFDEEGNFIPNVKRFLPKSSDKCSDGSDPEAVF